MHGTVHRLSERLQSPYSPKNGGKTVHSVHIVQSFHPGCTRIAHDKRKTIGKGDSNNWKEITKIIIKKENDCYLITIERNRKTVVTIINTVMIRASRFCSGEFTQLPMRRLLLTSFIK